MDISPLSPPADAAGRKILVTPQTRRVPEFVRQLNEWQFLERTLHRLLCAWGRHHGEIEDKAALHRHVWDQAEVVRRLRERIAQFPGGKPDAPVHPAFAALANAVLLAPGFQDVLDAIYHHLLCALVRAYIEHVQKVNPIHDAPTVALLHEINTIKEQQYGWYREYRRRHPHIPDAAYAAAVRGHIESLQSFRAPMPAFEGTGAPLCGVGTDFRLPSVGGRPAGWRPRYDLMPYLSADFTESIDARRLFWAYGYLLEINLPDAQLQWLYDGHHMPWDWHHDVSRHLWDESRHGLSGYSRLRDWGIPVPDLGLPAYGNGGLLRHAEDTPLAERIVDPFLDEPCCDLFAPAEPLTPAALYEAVFFIGMVAENGHFIVKNESYDDFREAGDLESAEMMLFDIIDETTHVQYAHRWLPELARQAGIDNGDYRARAARIRAEAQARENARSAEACQLPRTPGFGPWDHYQKLLARIRQAAPLRADFQPPRRSPKPM